MDHHVSAAEPHVLVANEGTSVTNTKSEHHGDISNFHPDIKSAPASNLETNGPDAATAGAAADPGSDADSDVELSPFALSALREFVSEQLERERRLEEAAQQPEDDADPDQEFQEDWQLSQFWYDARTCRVLAREAIRVAGPHGHVACLSSPTLYRHLRTVRPPGLRLTLLEFDTRFRVFGVEFVLYDYRAPLAVPEWLKQSCDVVVADPPFLSDECLTKTALTLRMIAKQKIVLCTGAQMGERAGRLLDLKECKFRPSHTNNLANEFRCFANYDMDEHIPSEDYGEIPRTSEVPERNSHETFAEGSAA